MKATQERKRAHEEAMKTLPIAVKMQIDETVTEMKAIKEQMNEGITIIKAAMERLDELTRVLEALLATTTDEDE